MTSNHQNIPPFDEVAQQQIAASAAKLLGGLRPIGEIVAGLIPKFAIRFHVNAAMRAAAGAAALEAFERANTLRRQARLSWREVFTQANRNDRHQSVA